jgi:hypothetical protein
MLLALSVALAVLTFVAEAVGIGLAFKVSPWIVLQMAFDFDLDAIRPGWLVLGAGLIVVLVDLVRANFARPRLTRAPKRPSGATPAEA